MNASGPLRIIFRADDAGVNQSATRAIAKCAEAGLVRNVGVMVPPATGPEALAPLRDLPDGIELGLHATITSEWVGQRWAPLLGAEAVPSLVRDDGSFLRATSDVQAQARPEEAEREIRAQLDRALAWGLRPTYLDAHMVFTWIDGLSESMAAICEDHGLVYANHPRFKGLPKADNPPSDARSALLARIRAVQGGCYVSVSHPSYAGDDTKGMYSKSSSWRKIVSARSAEAELLANPDFVAELLALGVTSATYSEEARKIAASGM